MKRQKKRFFTLVEILIVIGIIALLAGIAVPSYTQYMKSARITKAQAQITVFVQAINSFNMDMKLNLLWKWHLLKHRHFTLRTVVEVFI